MNITKNTRPIEGLLVILKGEFFMYKFPVTNNGVEYAVKIYSDSMLNAYHVKIYKKHRIFGKDINIKLKQSIYDVSSFDTYISDGTYFIEIATRTIEEYEKENQVISGINECIIKFNEWNGTL
jgi:hypothetical protein